MHLFSNFEPRPVQTASLVFVPQLWPEQNLVEFPFEHSVYFAVLVLGLNEHILGVAVQEVVVLQEQADQVLILVR